MSRRVATVLAAASLIAGCGSSGGSAPPAATNSAAPSATPTAAAVASSSTTTIVLPQGSDPVELDPAQFEGVPIDHTFWPMTPGSKWVYTETDGEGNEQQVVVEVLDETKEILGIQATVVHDVVSMAVHGEVVEDTFDWYAQDASGNLWYLGEDTKEFENGEVVSTEGSWEAGVDGALPGIILPADPQVGMTYRQEYYAGQAEDAAEILSLDEHVEVPAGTFDGCLRTRDYTPLDPDVEEEKYYCPDVGPAHVIQTKGGSSVEQLIEFTPGG